MSGGDLSALTGSGSAFAYASSVSASSVSIAGSAASPVSATKLGTEAGTEEANRKPEQVKPSRPRQEIMHASSLMSHLGPQVDGVNLLEIEAYLKRSKIARE